jgi:hypothetical protein
MATRTWRGDAANTAQVSTLTPANVIIGDQFVSTINGKSITFTATANTVANVTAGVNTAWNASTIEELAEITSLDSTTVITLTHDTAGVPFVVTATTANGGGANTETFVFANTTAASGPNIAGIAANWSGATLPANTDTVVFEYSDSDCWYRLDELAAIVVDVLKVTQSFMGDLGLPRTNATNGYIEYRATYFEVGANTCTIGLGEGTGSGRIKLDLCNSTCAVSIYNSGSAAETGIPAILLRDLGANSTCTVLKGDVGIAYFAEETATVLTLNVGYIDNVTGDADVYCGSGVTLTTVVKSGGNLVLNSNLTTLTQDAGTTTIQGAATATTINLRGGTLYDRSTGTYTTLTILGDGIYDHRGSLSAKTITNLTMYKGAQFYDPQGVVTITNGIDLVQCGLDDVIIDRPPNKTWTESAI